MLAGMEKQKQFITNAGHEMKTPLAIIQSNKDFLSKNTVRTTAKSNTNLIWLAASLLFLGLGLLIAKLYKQ